MKNVILLLLSCVACLGQTAPLNRVWGWCEQGNQTITVLGYTSSTSTPVQRSYSPCTITVYVSGTSTLASIYSTAGRVALANPFTANTNGYWFFYGDGRFDVQMSAGGFPSPVTLGDIASQHYTWVQDYGAKGDSSTDDSAAFQSAISGQSAGGSVFIPAGTYALASQITIGTPVRIQCDSKGGTILKPTSGLSSTLLSVTISGEGFSLDHCTFDMTNAPSQGVIALNGQVWPRISESRFKYPLNATGVAIAMQNTGFADLSHLYFTNPGTCISIQGDGGLEHQISHSRCDSAGIGIIVSRTGASDVGAVYIDDVQVVNAANRSGAQSIILTSTAANTSMPVQITASVADNATGGPALYVKNITQTSVSNSWFTSATAAIKLEGTTEFKATGNQNIQGAQYGFEFTGTNTTVFITGNKIFGATHDFHIDGGATLVGIQAGNNVAFYTTNNLPAIVQSGAPGVVTALGPVPLSSSGLSVWVDDSVAINFHSLQVCTTRTGVSVPCNYLTVNTNGDLVFVANDSATTNFKVLQSGGVSIGQGAAISLAQSSLIGGINFGVIGPTRCVDVTGVAFTGAAVGDSLWVSPPAAYMTTACGAVASCLTAHAFVTGPGIVTLRGCNVSGNSSSATGAQSFRVDLFKH